MGRDLLLNVMLSVATQGELYVGAFSESNTATFRGFCKLPEYISDLMVPATSSLPRLWEANSAKSHNVRRSPPDTQRCVEVTT